LAEIIKNAGLVQRHGENIETTAREIKEDIERRAKEVLALLQRDAE
jgi:endonuclease III